MTEQALQDEQILTTAKLAAHYVVVSFSLVNMPQRTIGSHDSEVPYVDDDLAEAFREIGENAPIHLLDKEFEANVEKFRGRMRSALGKVKPHKFDAGGGRVMFLIPQIHYGEVKKGFAKAMEEYDQWLASAPLDLYRAGRLSAFEHYYEKFKARFGEGRANDFKARMESRIATVEEMRQAHWTPTFEVINFDEKSLDQIGDPDLKKEILATRSQLAMDLTRDIPKTVRSSLINLLGELVASANPWDVSGHLIRRVRNVSQFALDNNFMSDSKITETATELQKLLVPHSDGSLTSDQERGKLEELRRTLVQQQALYAKRERTAPGAKPTVSVVAAEPAPKKGRTITNPKGVTKGPQGLRGARTTVTPDERQMEMF